MLASVRAGFAAALVAFFSFTAFAADKPFQRSDLADSAIRLETQIKTESGQVAKPVATLRSEAEAAFAKRDFRAGMQTLAQIVSVAPREAGNWLRLSRAILQIRPNRRPRAHQFPRARRNRRLHRLSALRQCRRRSRRAGAARPHLRGPQAVAPGARCLPPSRSTCANSPRCARATSSCATSTASAFSTIRWTPTRHRRAPASSSPKSCPASVPISRPSSRSKAPTSPPSARKKSSSASKA